MSPTTRLKHFENRDSLLAALATQEFQKLAAGFTALGQAKVQPLIRLKRALQAFSQYGQDYPSVHGLVDLETSGRMKTKKALSVLARGLRCF